MVEADRLISLSKFKTSRYMNISGPIKNMYGAVPGTTKFVYHSRFDDDRAFADLIVDVHLASSPAFHLVDAIEAIDDDGSRHGEIKRIGAVAAGRSAFALESLMIEVVGFEIEDSRVLAAAARRGLCPSGRWFTILGDDVERLKFSDFSLPSTNIFSLRVPARAAEKLARFLTVSPRPLPMRCTRCGTCVEICPRQAITMGEKAAEVDLKRCIRCFCCDELCEHDAIGLRKPLLMRLIPR
jgi:ferredoxin